MDLRSNPAAAEGPLPRRTPHAAQITLRASGSRADAPVACSVDLGRAVYEAQAHEGVGGAGTARLLGRPAARRAGCLRAADDCQMVATAMGIAAERIEVSVEGDLDLRGTLGVARDVGAGFAAIRLRFEVDAPSATDDQLASLQAKTERYCTVLQTLTTPPRLQTEFGRA